MLIFTGKGEAEDGDGLKIGGNQVSQLIMGRATLFPVGMRLLQGESMSPVTVYKVDQCLQQITGGIVNGRKVM